MKLNYKKSLIGSFIALLLGSSCCWLTTLAAWVGGVSIVTAFVSIIGKIEIYLIALGVFLGVLGLILYFYHKKLLKN